MTDALDRLLASEPLVADEPTRRRIGALPEPQRRQLADRLEPALQDLLSVVHHGLVAAEREEPETHRPDVRGLGHRYDTNEETNR